MNMANEIDGTLTEKGFVFLDNSSRPFLCRMWNGRPWLFSWQADHWVSLRPTTLEKAMRFPRNLTVDQQEVYHQRHDEYVGKQGTV